MPELRADVVVEIAFATDPGDAPVWTDVSDRVRGFSTSRGRQTELDRFEAGTGMVLLDNRDRALDPINEDGPNYPNVLPTRRTRIRLVYDAVSYGVLTGFANGFPQGYPNVGADAVVELGLTDGFKVLALATVGGTFPVQRTDERVDALLDDAEWPAADRDIEVGQSDIQEVLLAQSTALANLQIAEATENGRLFMNKDGLVRFIDRHTPLLDNESLATFGDAPGELPYTDLVLSYDDTNIWNRVRVAREGGTTQQADGVASQLRHHRRTLEVDTLITSDLEAADAAAWLLSRYEDPDIRADELVVNPLADPALWPVILSLELGDRVTVKKRPLGGGDAIVRDVTIEGIAWRYDLDSFEWRARLAPASIDGYWVLGDPLLGVLGETTRLAY